MTSHPRLLVFSAFMTVAAACSENKLVGVGADATAEADCKSETGIETDTNADDSDAEDSSAVDSSSPETGGGSDVCGPATTPDELDHVLQGRWSGTVYTFDYEAVVSLQFNSDHTFNLDFAGDDGDESITCSNVSDRTGGVSWEVMGPTMVMVSIENPNFPDCGEELERAALTNIWVTPDCTLTGYSESPSFWDNTNKGIFRVRKE